MCRTAALFLAAGGLAAIATLLFPSCRREPTELASIWTDVPELAIAVELFDAREGSTAVRLAWKRDLTAALLATVGGKKAPGPPTLVVGRRLACAALRDRLCSLDYLLKELPSRDAVYPELLEGGIIDGKRILLPLSFNLPAIAFLRDARAAGDGVALSLEDMAAPSAAYGRQRGASGARMGFSPRWNERFLVKALDSGGARFQEGGAARGLELGWDPRGLSAALDELASWSVRANGSAALEDDFQFKYLFAPPYRWLKEGRTLYAYMDSSEFFAVPEEKRAALDFRWFEKGGRVPVSDGTVYAGIMLGSSGRATAESFLRWFLTPEAQRAILERSRDDRALSFSFGVAGGFSSIRSANESIFPAFYPALVGRAPPAGKLSAPARLPEDWPALQAAVIAPWALEAMASRQSTEGSPSPDPSEDLAARLGEYHKRNEAPKANIN
jgi:ABC-type glycerol-3-phosphate transport system substrate-binding protein